jgi:hypothetical protein
MGPRSGLDAFDNKIISCPYEVLEIFKCMDVTFHFYLRFPYYIFV